ncbi:MAG: response regulator [Cyanobacteria bacterium SBLK]|nr:response regulator [Cyanobacteria bacterium SBLK]
MASGKVLILDENHATRTQLRELLPKGQYEIQEASDGERGLSLIQQERANIRFIILDSALPKVNGWDVVERLQADAELQRIPLVMMTRLSNMPPVSHPMIEFLQKPFEKKTLRTVVKNAIGKAISVYQETLDDRQEEPIVSPSDREESIIERPVIEEPTVEESITTVQNSEENSSIDLDNMFESFVESERDRTESDEVPRELETALELIEAEERELDFSFDTTGTEDAIDKEEMSALGLSFPALDTAIATEADQEESEERLEFEIETTEIEQSVEIDRIASFDRAKKDSETDFSFDTTGTDETIDIKKIEDLELRSGDASFLSELDASIVADAMDEEELEIDEFPSLDIDLSMEDLSPEIDEFPSLDIDLSMEDLSPEIDEFPSLDISLSMEDLSPEIDEFPSLDISLSTEDLSPEIDEFPSLDISLSTEDSNIEINELNLDISSSDEEQTWLSDREEYILRDEQKEVQENLEVVSDKQDVAMQALEQDLENQETKELSSLDTAIFNLEENEQDRQQKENLLDSFKLEELSNETNLPSTENISEFIAEEVLTPAYESSQDDLIIGYTSGETEALIDESFADLETEEPAPEPRDSEASDLIIEYTSEETEALIDESFADLEINELLSPPTSNDESELATRLISDDPLPTNHPFSEESEPLETLSEEPEESDVGIFDEENELSVFAEDFPRELEREIEPYNTSDEDIREDYHRSQSQNDSFFDSSLTLDLTEQIQYPAEDIFSTPNTSEPRSDDSVESDDNLFISPPPIWEEKTNARTDSNESDSIFDPSLQLDEETITYTDEADNIFPPLGETDLFEPEAPLNESFASDPSHRDTAGVEEFDRELTSDTPAPESEEEYTILEDKRSTSISLPKTSTPLEESEGEHTIFEDKRNPKIVLPPIESTEETENFESEEEFTVLEDKRNIDLADRSLDSEKEPDPDLVRLEAETPLQLNKVFIESNRETEVSHLVNLSGFEDVLMRYKSTVEEVKISALKEAFDYDEPGYRLIINALREESSEIRQTAEQLLIEHLKKPRVQVLPLHENWASLQCLHTLRGHSYWVQDVAIAPDGRTIVSASKDGTIKIWDMLTGREMRTLHGHEAAVLSVTIGSDGERIISCGTDNTIKIWSLDTGAELNSILGKSHKVYVLDLSPDGKSVISASADNTIKPKYDGGLEAFLNRIPSRRVNALLSLIGILKRSPAIKIWDLDKGKPKGNFRGYSRGVTDLAISPKGDKVVSGSRDRTIKIWDFKTGKNLDTLWGHNDEIRSVAISPDGKTIVSGSRDRTIKIWDMQSGHVLRTLRGHGQSVTSVAVSPDGNIIASGSRDSSIKIWDFHTGEFINTLLGHTDLVRSVAIDGDGKTIVSGSRDNTIKVWGNIFQ